MKTFLSFLLLLLFILLAALALTACGPKSVAYKDRSAAPAPTPYKLHRVFVHRDEETGCQYLAGQGSGSGLTPRLDAQGKHICK